MAWYTSAPEGPVILPDVITSKDLAGYQKQYDKAQADSLKASERRAALPLGSSRARLTSANAKWMIAAEYRDRCLRKLEAAQEAFTTQKGVTA